jgi:AraC-like DNA-binding protein
MKLYTLPIPQHLRDYIECFRVITHPGQGKFSINVCLNGLPGIVFQHTNRQSPVESIVTSSKRNVHIPALYIYGQMTEPSIMNYTGEPYSMTQVILKPHGLNTLFGMNAAVLTDGLAEFDAVDARCLNEQLMNAKSEQERNTLLMDFLSAQINRQRAADTLVIASLKFIHAHSGCITIKDLLTHLHISQRQFERRFRQMVGISPQFYLRVKRFNAALQLMQSGRFNRLTDVAHSLSFHDQSHFIRDVKQLAGVAPRTLLQKIDTCHLRHGVNTYS